MYLKYTVVLAVLALVLLSIPDEAKAAPQLQIGCKVAKIEQMDPIIGGPKAHSHNHVFFGNKNVRHTSTYDQLIRSKATTCNKGFDTNSYWVPVVRGGNEVLKAQKVTAYYVGNHSKIRPIPRGLKTIGTRADWRCGMSRPTAGPPTGCKAKKVRVRVHFPDCWNRKGKEPGSLVYSKRGNCPKTHSYRLPKMRVAVHYENQGTLKAPFRVSAGEHGWKTYEYMHGDIFFAAQQPRFDRMINKCVISGRDMRGCGGRNG